MSTSFRWWGGAIKEALPIQMMLLRIFWKRNLLIKRFTCREKKEEADEEKSLWAWGQLW